MEEKSLAKKIISNIKNNFINADGYISRTYPVSKRTIFDNFDDLAPFLIYFGEIDFLIDQIYKIGKIPFEDIVGHNGIILSHKIDEYIGGLYALYKATGKTNPYVRNLLSEAVEKVFAYFIRNNDLLIGYDVFNKRIINVRTYWSSGILETFLEMRDDYPDLLPVTLEITKTWISDSFFLQHGLFPFRVNPRSDFFNKINNKISFKHFYCSYLLNKEVPIPKKGKHLKFQLKKIFFERIPTGNFVQLMKANSTMVFLLIELYKLTNDHSYRDAIEHWIESSREKLFENGNVFGLLDMKFNRYSPTLSDAFIYIDILCDSFFFINRKIEYLEVAKDIAEKWLDLRWNNGLIPMFEECEVDHIDNLVDFSISLRRLSELMQKEIYLTEAKRIMASTIDFHDGEFGLYTHVSKTGLKIANKQFNNIDPKYNALFLKGLINLITLDEQIYTSNLHDIFKDR